MQIALTSLNWPQFLLTSLDQNKDIIIKKTWNKTSTDDIRGTLTSTEHLVLPFYQIKPQFIAL